MNEILLFLSIKYYGDWLNIYNSLQKREPIPKEQFYDEIKKIKCDFTTIIDEDYCDNLKTIYKPPFSIYHYGNYELTKNKSISIIGDFDDLKQPYQDYFTNNNVVLIWSYQSQKNIFKILTQMSKNNIFFSKDIVSQKYLKFLQKDDEILAKNMFMSEIWCRNIDHDYGNQDDERLYCGISKTILVVSKPPHKQWLSILAFAKKEGITINVLNNVYEENKKIFNDIRNIQIIKFPQQIDQILYKK